jgi:integrase-like protein
MVCIRTKRREKKMADGYVVEITNPPHVEGKPLRQIWFAHIPDLRIRFADWCKEAGLPDECRAHGLRKLMLTKIGNAGGTHHELKALSGHKHSADADHYTRAYDQRRGALAAFRKLKAGTKIG